MVPTFLTPPQPPPSPEPVRTPRAGVGEGASIWLVRHGKVSAPTTTYGDNDVELSKEGHAQTERIRREVAAFISPVRVVTSPLERALALGEAISTACRCKVTIDRRLKELNRGHWQGLDGEEYARRWHEQREDYWYDPLAWRGHGGESEKMLLDRTWPVLMDLSATTEGATGVITAHRQVIRCLVAAAIGIPPGKSHDMQIEPSHSIQLIDSPNGWMLGRTNVAIPGAPHAAEPLSGPPKDVTVR